MERHVNLTTEEIESIRSITENLLHGLKNIKENETESYL